MEANYSQEKPWFPGPSSPYTLPQALLIGLLLLVVITVTIVGNILVCVAVCLVKKLRRPCNYLLVSLAVSDLCVAILVMPMALLYEIIGAWNLGPIMCDIWVSFDVLSCTASILNLCMISVDRYYAITKPLEYGVKRTPKRMILCVSMVWLGAACISLPPLLILGNTHGETPGHPGTQCLVCQNFGYQIYATLGSFYIPLSVMMFVYYKIFRAARKIVREERRAQTHLETSHCYLEINKNGSGPESKLTVSSASSPAARAHHRTSTSSTNTTCSGSVIGATRVSSESTCPILTGRTRRRAQTQAAAPNRKLRFQLAKERKASTTLGIIMSAFTVCWLPFFVLAVVRPFLANEKAIPSSLSSLFLWLGYANSLLNPVIYATLNRDFRRPFQQILYFSKYSQGDITIITVKFRQDLKFELNSLDKAYYIQYLAATAKRPLDIKYEMPVYCPGQFCLNTWCGSLNHMMREEFYHSQYGDPNPMHLNDDEPTCDLLPVSEVKGVGVESFL